MCIFVLSNQRGSTNVIGLPSTFSFFMPKCTRPSLWIQIMLLLGLGFLPTSRTPGTTPRINKNSIDETTIFYLGNSPVSYVMTVYIKVMAKNIQNYTFSITGFFFLCFFLHCVTLVAKKTHGTKISWNIHFNLPFSTIPRCVVRVFFSSFLCAATDLLFLATTNIKR